MYIVLDQKMDLQLQFSYGLVINMVSEIIERKVKKFIYFIDMVF